MQDSETLWPMARSSSRVRLMVAITSKASLTPKDDDKIAQLISLEELKGRVTESAVVARQVLEMQADFSVATGG